MVRPAGRWMATMAKLSGLSTVLAVWQLRMVTAAVPDTWVLWAAGESRDLFWTADSCATVTLPAPEANASEGTGLAPDEGVEDLILVHASHEIIYLQTGRVRRAWMDRTGARELAEVPSSFAGDTGGTGRRRAGSLALASPAAGESSWGLFLASQATGDIFVSKLSTAPPRYATDLGAWILAFKTGSVQESFSAPRPPVPVLTARDGWLYWVSSDGGIRRTRVTEELLTGQAGQGGTVGEEISPTGRPGGAGGGVILAFEVTRHGFVWIRQSVDRSITRIERTSPGSLLSGWTAGSAELLYRLPQGDFAGKLAIARTDPILSSGIEEYQVWWAVSSPVDRARIERLDMIGSDDGLSAGPVEVVRYMSGLERRAGELVWPSSLAVYVRPQVCITIGCVYLDVFGECSNGCSNEHCATCFLDKDNWVINTWLASYGIWDTCVWLFPPDEAIPLVRHQVEVAKQQGLLPQDFDESLIGHPLGSTTTTPPPVTKATTAAPAADGSAPSFTRPCVLTVNTSTETSTPSPPRAEPQSTWKFTNDPDLAECSAGAEAWCAAEYSSTAASNVTIPLSLFKGCGLYWTHRKLCALSSPLLDCQALPMWWWASLVGASIAGFVGAACIFLLPWWCCCCCKGASAAKDEGENKERDMTGLRTTAADGRAESSIAKDVTDHAGLPMPRDLDGCSGDGSERGRRRFCACCRKRRRGHGHGSSSKVASVSSSSASLAENVVDEHGFCASCGTKRPQSKSNSKTPWLPDPPEEAAVRSAKELSAEPKKRKKTPPPNSSIATHAIWQKKPAAPAAKPGARPATPAEMPPKMPGQPFSSSGDAAEITADTAGGSGKQRRDQHGAESMRKDLQFQMQPAECQQRVQDAHARPHKENEAATKFSKLSSQEEKEKPPPSVPSSGSTQISDGSKASETPSSVGQATQLPASSPRSSPDEDAVRTRVSTASSSDASFKRRFSNASADKHKVDDAAGGYSQRAMAEGLGTNASPEASGGSLPQQSRKGSRGEASRLRELAGSTGHRQSCVSAENMISQESHPGLQQGRDPADSLRSGSLKAARLPDEADHVRPRRDDRNGEGITAQGSGEDSGRRSESSKLSEQLKQGRASTGQECPQDEATAALGLRQRGWPRNTLSRHSSPSGADGNHHDHVLRHGDRALTETSMASSGQPLHGRQQQGGKAGVEAVSAGAEHMQSATPFEEGATAAAPILAAMRRAADEDLPPTRRRRLVEDVKGMLEEADDLLPEPVCQVAWAWYDRQVRRQHGHDTDSVVPGAHNLQGGGSSSSRTGVVEDTRPGGAVGSAAADAQSTDEHERDDERRLDELRRQLADCQGQLRVLSDSGAKASPWLRLGRCLQLQRRLKDLAAQQAMVMEEVAEGSVPAQAKGKQLGEDLAKLLEEAMALERRNVQKLTASEDRTGDGGRHQDQHSENAAGDSSSDALRRTLQKWRDLHTLDIAGDVRQLDVAGDEASRTLRSHAWDHAFCDRCQAHGACEEHAVATPPDVCSAALRAVELDAEIDRLRRRRERRSQRGANSGADVASPLLTAGLAAADREALATLRKLHRSGLADLEHKAADSTGTSASGGASSILQLSRVADTKALNLWRHGLQKKLDDLEADIDKAAGAALLHVKTARRPSIAESSANGTPSAQDRDVGSGQPSSEFSTPLARSRSRLSTFAKRRTQTILASPANGIAATPAENGSGSPLAGKFRRAQTFSMGGSQDAPGVLRGGALPADLLNSVRDVALLQEEVNGWLSALRKGMAGSGSSQEKDGASVLFQQATLAEGLSAWDRFKVTAMKGVAATEEALSASAGANDGHAEDWRQLLTFWKKVADDLEAACTAPSTKPSAGPGSRLRRFATRHRLSVNLGDTGDLGRKTEAEAEAEQQSEHQPAAAPLLDASKLVAAERTRRELLRFGRVVRELASAAHVEINTGELLTAESSLAGLLGDSDEADLLKLGRRAAQSSAACWLRQEQVAGELACRETLQQDVSQEEHDLLSRLADHWKMLLEVSGDAGLRLPHDACRTTGIDRDPADLFYRSSSGATSPHASGTSRNSTSRGASDLDQGQAAAASALAAGKLPAEVCKAAVVAAAAAGATTDGLARVAVEAARLAGGSSSVGPCVAGEAAARAAIDVNSSLDDVVKVAADAAKLAGGSPGDIARVAGAAAAESAVASGLSEAGVARQAAEATLQAGGSVSEAARAAGAAAEAAMMAGFLPSPLAAGRVARDAAFATGASSHDVAGVAAHAAAQTAMAEGRPQDLVLQYAAGAAREAGGSSGDVAAACSLAAAQLALARSSTPGEIMRQAAGAAQAVDAAGSQLADAVFSAAAGVAADSGRPLEVFAKAAYDAASAAGVPVVAIAAAARSAGVTVPSVAWEDSGDANAQGSAVDAAVDEHDALGGASQLADVRQQLLVSFLCLLGDAQSSLSGAGGATTMGPPDHQLGGAADAAAAAGIIAGLSPLEVGRAAAHACAGSTSSDAAVAAGEAAAISALAAGMDASGVAFSAASAAARGGASPADLRRLVAEVAALAAIRSSKLDREGDDPTSRASAMSPNEREQVAGMAAAAAAQALRSIGQGGESADDLSALAAAAAAAAVACQVPSNGGAGIDGHALVAKVATLAASAAKASGGSDAAVGEAVGEASARAAIGLGLMQDQAAAMATQSAADAVQSSSSASGPEVSWDAMQKARDAVNAAFERQADEAAGSRGRRQMSFAPDEALKRAALAAAARRAAAFNEDLEKQRLLLQRLRRRSSGKEHQDAAGGGEDCASLLSECDEVQSCLHDLRTKRGESILECRMSSDQGLVEGEGATAEGRSRTDEQGHGAQAAGKAWGLLCELWQGALRQNLEKVQCEADIVEATLREEKLRQQRAAMNFQDEAARRAALAEAARRAALFEEDMQRQRERMLRMRRSVARQSDGHSVEEGGQDVMQELCDIKNCLDSLNEDRSRWLLQCDTTLASLEASSAASTKQPWLEVRRVWQAELGKDLDALRHEASTLAADAVARSQRSRLPQNFMDDEARRAALAEATRRADLYQQQLEAQRDKVMGLKKRRRRQAAGTESSQAEVDSTEEAARQEQLEARAEDAETVQELDVLQRGIERLADERFESMAECEVLALALESSGDSSAQAASHGWKELAARWREGLSGDLAVTIQEAVAVETAEPTQKDSRLLQKLERLLPSGADDAALRKALLEAVVNRDVAIQDDAEVQRLRLMSRKRVCLAAAREQGEVSAKATAAAAAAGSEQTPGGRDDPKGEDSSKALCKEDAEDIAAIDAWQRLEHLEQQRKRAPRSGMEGVTDAEIEAARKRYKDMHDRFEMLRAHEAEAQSLRATMQQPRRRRKNTNLAQSPPSEVAPDVHNADGHRKSATEAPIREEAKSAGGSGPSQKRRLGEDLLAELEGVFERASIVADMVDATCREEVMKVVLQWRNKLGGGKPESLQLPEESANSKPPGQELGIQVTPRAELAQVPPVDPANSKPPGRELGVQVTPRVQAAQAGSDVAPSTNAHDEASKPEAAVAGQSAGARQLPSHTITVAEVRALRVAGEAGAQMVLAQIDEEAEQQALLCMQLAEERRQRRALASPMASTTTSHLRRSMSHTVRSLTRTFSGIDESEPFMSPSRSLDRSLARAARRGSVGVVFEAFPLDDEEEQSDEE
eukprot:TRINITY_DN50601_c0_g1_i2.p1 TRINITY_DN50601_c0_g1~~TRINITY_DN50601_c0_g1_i2.p1  ORF type:complete len:3658 (-),score=805.60 TRINITY_DN50601_c0_g1_i2:506-11479(-)